MRKITKQFLGCLGLLIVGSMTFIAYNLPEPVIAAETTDSVTDTITVANISSYEIILYFYTLE